MLGATRPTVPKRPATYDDVVAAPEHVVAELIDDTLYTSPRPSSLHARAAGRMFAEIDRIFGRTGGSDPGGWIILVEPELHIVGQAMVPDLAGWRRERMPEMPVTAAFELAPDWLCEVRSASTGLLDRKIKLPKYAQAGVSHAWIIDPEEQSLVVLRRTDAGTWEILATFGDDDKVRAAPFEAAELDLSLLWER
jgi:Uma2 family endonuclease